MSTEQELAQRAGLIASLRARAAARRRQRWDSYDAFISYSRADTAFAAQLQTDVERFAKPWNRARSAKLFRDISSLAPRAGLWDVIESGLRRARWLIVCLSPEGAGSRWVNQEIKWWVENRGTETILLILAEGTLAWDGSTRDFAAARSTALPSALTGVYRTEPMWLDASWSRTTMDARMQDVVASVSATLRDVPKDELYGVAVHEHRRARRLARGAQIGLVTLLVVACVAAVVAIEQRSKAVREATLAESRQLAALSLNESRTNLDVSMLLAAHARRRDENAQTSSALLRAALESPNLVRYFDLPAEVTALAGSGSGRVMVAGLSDGSVYRWPIRAASPERVARLRGRVTHVAVDAAGSTIAASDEQRAVVWRAGRSAAPVTVPEGQAPGSVAVSPSGRTVAIDTSGAVGGAESSILFESPTKRPVPVDDDFDPDRLLLPSDEEIVLLRLAYGAFERRRLSDWELTSPRRAGSASFGARQGAGEPSADGEFLTATNGATTIPVWRTAMPVPRNSELVAEAPITGPGETTLDADGDRLAAADSGTIYVTDVIPRGNAPPTPVTLTGSGNVDLLRFIGDDGTALLAASRRRVALWATNQIDRLARVSRSPLPTGCTACDAARITVSPDGRRAALLDGFGTTAILHSLSRRKPEIVIDGLESAEYRGAMWDADGRFVTIPFDPSSSDVPTLRNGPDVLRLWQAGDAVDDIIATGGTESGDAVTVTQRGQIRVHDLESGAVRRTYRGPADLEVGDASLTAAAVAPGGDHVAYVDKRVVIIVRASTGERLRRFQREEVRSVAFGGTRLLIQLASGDLEVWTADGSHLERTIAGDRSFVAAPVVNEQGTLVARRRLNNDIVLVDLSSGTALATIPPNPGARALRVGTGFSPDGKRLITVTDELKYRAGAVVVDRDISSDALLTSLCRAAGRNLADSEWRRFVGTTPPEDLRCKK